MSVRSSLVGTSTETLKPYYRLTKEPEKALIRPINVLKKAYDVVRSRWDAEKDYEFVNDQMKSIRQDLYVQEIRNEFTVILYETHARLALENGDFREFNVCQSQLKVLYNFGLQSEFVNEFLSYRLLYYLFTSNTDEYIQCLRSITKKQLSDPLILFARKAFTAWNLEDYPTFFKLYQSSSGLQKKLIGLSLHDVRKKCMKVLHKAFKPTLPISFIQESLSFPNEEEAEKYLTENGYEVKDGFLNCRVQPKERKADIKKI